METRSPRILLVTGEASGDAHGGQLARALLALSPHARLEGLGGREMHEAGVTLISGVTRVDAIGVPGVTQLLQGARTLYWMKRLVRRERYDAVVLIDSPGMNLRLAKTAASVGQRVVYYIAPQVWAWGRRRLHVIRRAVTRLLVILPFEEAWFRRAEVACDFVGHPLLDQMAETYNRTALREAWAIDGRGPVLGLLPGSREHEVIRGFSTMLAAAGRVADTVPHVSVLVARASSIPSALIADSVRRVPHLRVTVIDQQPNEVMAAADLLFVASGTATLQAALIGTPMIVTYRVPWLTYQLGKRLIHIPSIGLVNIVAGKSVAPELIQDEFTEARLAETALGLLRAPDRLAAMREDFLEIRRSLGAPGASRRAAEYILAEAAR